MKGVYTAAAATGSISASGLLAYYTAPSAKVGELLALTVTNESNATNFQMEIAIKQITTLGTPSPAGTSVTPTPHEAGDQASGSTFKIAGSSPIGSTTPPTTYGSVMTQEGAPSLPGYRWEPTSPDERLYVAPGATIGILLNTTPAAATTFDVRMTWKEIG